MSDPKIEHVLIGHIGVDSGQVMIGDPGYLEEFDSDEFTEDLPEQTEFDFSYSGACGASFSGGNVVGSFPHIEGAGRAVASLTPHGDGIFPVFQVVVDGELVGLFVDFE